MNILILSWRDFRNPHHGGAEILTHELAKRWVRRGHRVTLVTSGFPGANRRETIEGIEIRRYGQWWSIHAIAFLLYFFGDINKADTIVDEAHWFPFFSILYARKKVVLLVCEVATHLFSRMFPSPIAWFWRSIERIYFRLYRGVPLLAISSSTKQALIESGFSEDTITLIPMGITVPGILPKTEKEKQPTLIFVGRVHPLKGVEDAVHAFGILRRRALASKLWIVGSGEEPYVSFIRALTQKLGLGPSVRFFGHVSEEKKFALLSRAQILLVTSLQEGWGLVVPEAGIVGTPAVGFDVAGLRDVIRDRKTGILVKDHTPEALAQAVGDLLINKATYQKLKQGVRLWNRYASWDTAASAVLQILV